MFNNFLETVIFKNDTNITISGLKVFKSPITFNSTFIIDGSLNNLDLNRFKNAVYIDKPFSIDIKIIFKEDVYISKALVVKTELQSNTIMKVDMQDLQENVIALNKLNYFSGNYVFIYYITYLCVIKKLYANTNIQQLKAF